MQPENDFSDAKAEKNKLLPPIFIPFSSSDELILVSYFVQDPANALFSCRLESLYQICFLISTVFLNFMKIFHNNHSFNQI
jgi:hypothetical protein